MDVQKQDNNSLSMSSLPNELSLDAKDAKPSTTGVLSVFTFLGPPVGAVLLLIFLLYGVVVELSVEGKSWLDILSFITDRLGVLLELCFTSYLVGGIPAIFTGVCFAFWFRKQKNRPSFWKAGLVGALQGGMHSDLPCSLFFF